MFSVLMPAYNSSKTIGQSIESILNQTYREFELIVVDDGSTDGTVNIIKGYAEKDQRVRLIQQQNAGVGAARNTGLKEAQYPWIALLDSDDLALPHRFEKQRECIQSDPEVVVWASAVRHMGFNGEILDDVKEVGPATKAAFDKIRKSWGVVYAATTAAVFRKDIALKIGGFDERFKSAGDTEFWNRMADHGPVIGIPEPLVLYRVHHLGIMDRRFAELYRNTKYIEQRSAARAKGDDLSFDAFLADYDHKPPLARLARYADQKAQFYYRRAGIAASSKHYPKFIMYLALAVAYNPLLITKRIWKRVSKRIFGG